MKLKNNFKENLKRAAFVVLATVATTAAHAQTAIDTLDSANRAQENPFTAQQTAEEPLSSSILPELYEGEIDDLGPQFLLLERQRYMPFSFFADVQLYRTSNAALAEYNVRATNVTVGTAQLTYAPEAKIVRGGQLALRTGARYQWFRYGAIEGDNDQFGSAKIDQLDFDARGWFADATYSKGKWSLQAAIRYTSLINAHGLNENTYDEWVPGATLTRYIPFNDKTLGLVSYGINFRLTDSDTFGGLQAEGWNDRTEHFLSVAVNRIVTEKLFFQPAYRIQYSDYTHAGRSREDIMQNFSLSLNYVYSKRINFRTFASYDIRTSTDTVSSNAYQNWNVGIGASANIKF